MENLSAAKASRLMELLTSLFKDEAGVSVTRHDQNVEVLFIDTVNDIQTQQINDVCYCFDLKHQVFINKVLGGIVYSFGC